MDHTRLTDDLYLVIYRYLQTVNELISLCTVFSIDGDYLLRHSSIRLSNRNEFRTLKSFLSKDHVAYCKEIIFLFRATTTEEECKEFYHSKLTGGQLQISFVWIGLSCLYISLFAKTFKNIDIIHIHVGSDQNRVWTANLFRKEQKNQYTKISIYGGFCSIHQDELSRFPKTRCFDSLNLYHTRVPTNYIIPLLSKFVQDLHIV